MPRILVIDRPMQTFTEAERRARESMTRPLNATDYYLARFDPKDKKRANDGYSLGATYLERHAARNWKAGKKSKAVAQGALAPVAQVAAFLGCALIWLPNATVLFF